MRSKRLRCSSADTTLWRVRGPREIVCFEMNHAIGEVTGGVARKGDRFDVMAVSIEELLRHLRDISGHSSEPLQSLEGDATAYLCGTIA